MFRVNRVLFLACLLICSWTSMASAQVFLVGAHYYSSDAAGNSLGPYEYSTNSASIAFNLQLNLGGNIQSSGVSYPLASGNNNFTFSFLEQSFNPGAFGGIGLFFSSNSTSFNPNTTTGVAGDLVATTPTDSSGIFTIPVNGSQVRTYDLQWNSSGVFQTPYSGATSFQLGDQIMEITAFSSTDTPTGSFTINVSTAAVPEPSTMVLLGVTAIGSGLVMYRRRKHKRRLAYLSMALAIMGTMTSQAQADVITINYTDSGWWNNIGDHSANNENYFAGQSFHVTRNFFVFDLTGVSGTVIGATLKLYNPTSDVFEDYGQFGPLRTYSVFDVSTSIAALTTTGSGQTGIYADLGTGTNLGNNNGPQTDGTILDTSLNASGLAYIQAGLGGLIAFGGTYVNASIDNYLFGFSGSPGDVRQLEIITAEVRAVPVPAGIVLAGMGMLSIAGFTMLRRRQTRIIAESCHKH